MGFRSGEPQRDEGALPRERSDPLAELGKPTADPWERARVLAGAGRSGEASRVLEASLGRAVDAESQAARACEAAELMERAGDGAAALRFFGRGLDFHPLDPETRYVLHTGAARCLNLMARHRDAEAHCRAGIGLAPGRREAYEALGVSQEGRSLFGDAARSYILAAIAEPRSGSGIARLEHLLSAHPEIEAEHPEIGKHHRYCLEAHVRARATAPNPTSAVRSIFRRSGGPSMR